MTYQHGEKDEDEIKEQTISDVSDSEMYDFLDYDMNYLIEDIEGKETLLYADVFANDLSVIEEFVTDAIFATEPAFIISENRGKRLAKVSKWFKPYFGRLGSLYSVCQSEFSFGPRVNLFSSYSQEFCFLHDFSSDPSKPMQCRDGMLFGNRSILADGYNAQIDQLRRDYKAKKISRKIAKRNENAKLNYRNSCTYVNGLFEKYARLAVVRLDVGYGKAITGAVTVEQAMEDYRTFIQKRRGKRSVFGHMLGYVAKLEYSNLKGYHFHLMLFFDGSKVQNHSHYAEEVGKYWRDDVTAGKGTYYNCNRHPNKYKRCGIGRVDHWDSVKRANVLYALSYLTKSEQYVMVKTSKGARTFFMGQPRKQRSKAGRPRVKMAMLPDATVLEAQATFVTTTGTWGDTGSMKGNDRSFRC